MRVGKGDGSRLPEVGQADQRHHRPVREAAQDVRRGPQEDQRGAKGAVGEAERAGEDACLGCRDWEEEERSVAKLAFIHSESSVEFEKKATGRLIVVRAAGISEECLGVNINYWRRDSP